MFATKIKGRVTADGRLVVALPDGIAPGSVEVIVLHESQPKPRKMSARRKTTHPAFGLWANRKDIKDTAEFAAQLSRRLEMRQDRSG